MNCLCQPISASPADPEEEIAPVFLLVPCRISTFGITRLTDRAVSDMFVYKHFVYPVQGKMIHGLRHLRKEKLEFIHESVQTLVEIMEAQNLKVTFFFDRE